MVSQGFGLPKEFNMSTVQYVETPRHKDLGLMQGLMNWLLLLLPVIIPKNPCMRGGQLHVTAGSRHVSAIVASWTGTAAQLKVALAAVLPRNLGVIKDVLREASWGRFECMSHIY